MRIFLLFIFLSSLSTMQRLSANERTTSASTRPTPDAGQNQQELPGDRTLNVQQFTYALRIIREHRDIQRIMLLQPLPNQDQENHQRTD